MSVGNINDAVKDKTTPLATLYKKVWDYTPNVNLGTTKSIVDSAIANYTNPASKDLVAKAIDLISEELPTLLDKLEKKGKIQRKK